MSTSRAMLDHMRSLLLTNVIAGEGRDDAGYHRWFLRRADGGGHDYAEIVQLRGGRLYVGGDHTPVIFGFYSPTSTEVKPEHVLGQIEWIANADLRYATEKAAHGSYGRSPVREFDEDEALALLVEARNRHVEDQSFYGNAIARFQTLQSQYEGDALKRAFLNYYADSAMHEIMEQAVLTCSHVLFAKAAVEHLYRLLIAR